MAEEKEAGSEKLYTRKGDKGITCQYNGTRTPKSAMKVEAVGNLDAAQSWLGVVASTLPPDLSCLKAPLMALGHKFYRLQCDSEGALRAYIAQGEVLPVKTRSFGGIGVFAIPEMGRFYRHVLIEKRYPHHGAVAFSHCGKTLFEVFKYFGITDIAHNRPAGCLYPTENPMA